MKNTNRSKRDVIIDIFLLLLCIMILIGIPCYYYYDWYIANRSCKVLGTKIEVVCSNHHQNCLYVGAVKIELGNIIDIVNVSTSDTEITVKDNLKAFEKGSSVLCYIKNGRLKINDSIHVKWDYVVTLVIITLIYFSFDMIGACIRISEYFSFEEKDVDVDIEKINIEKTDYNDNRCKIIMLIITIAMFIFFSLIYGIYFINMSING